MIHRGLAPQGLLQIQMIRICVLAVASLSPSKQGFQFGSSTNMAVAQVDIFRLKPPTKSVVLVMILSLGQSVGCPSFYLIDGIVSSNTINTSLVIIPPTLFLLTSLPSHDWSRVLLGNCSYSYPTTIIGRREMYRKTQSVWGLEPWFQMFPASNGFNFHQCSSFFHIFSIFSSIFLNFPQFSCIFIHFPIFFYLPGPKIEVFRWFPAHLPGRPRLLGGDGFVRPCGWLTNKKATMSGGT